mmetsp:Transcript_25262/g.37299  ORF Transcript_25262/g.37299 Transcript_25262/m.37299 type:complete len:185 (-) Transcript_25262:188-742(-)
MTNVENKGHDNDHPHNEFFELQAEIFEQALHYINLIGSWVLLFAVAIALLNVGLLVIQYFTGFKLKILFALTQPNAKSLTLDHIKLELSRIVSFSLLLLVAADVLETLLKPLHDLTMEDLYKMAIVGAIRTTLAYFLGKEMEEIMHHIEHAEHNHHDESKMETPPKQPNHTEATAAKMKKKKKN